MVELFCLMAKSGAVRGPFRERLLPSIGKALRDEQWPLPLAIRALKLRELAVLERRVLDEHRSSICGVLRITHRAGGFHLLLARLRKLVQG